MKKILYLVMILILWTVPVLATEDGTIVTTSSGSYTVPVEVKDDKVIYVYWPNGGNMTVYGAEINDCEAQGTNSKGDWVMIELEDCISEMEKTEE